MHIPFENLLWVVGEQVLNIDLALINAKRFCPSIIHTYTTRAGIRLILAAQCYQTIAFIYIAFTRTFLFVFLS